MKKTISIIAAVLTVQAAQALVVSVNGYGEIPAEGLEIEMTEGETDILSGDYVMKIEGNLISAGNEVQVRINRPEAGLSDEFCCGSNCTPGNRETAEERIFETSGLTSWYIHYNPREQSDIVIEYVFADGEEELSLTARFIRSTESLVLIEDGKITNGVYSISGTRIESSTEEMPEGIYIKDGKKIYVKHL